MRMKIKRKSAKEHNESLNKRKTKPDGMTAMEWNRHLNELKRQGKYNGEIYAKTRTELDEMWEIEEDLNRYNRGEE
jgi:hypothetical protein